MRDLGIIINTNFIFDKQYIKSKNIANKMLEFINSNVSYKSKDVIRIFDCI